MQKTLLAIALAALTAIPAISADEAAPAEKNIGDKITDVKPDNITFIEPDVPEMTPARKAQAFEAFGYFIASQTNLESIGMENAEIESFVKGLRLALAGKEPSVPMEKIAPELGPLLTQRATAFTKAWDAKNREFLEKIATEKGVIKTESGLCYQIIDAGKDPKPTEKSIVSVTYKGTLVNDRVFDSTENNDNNPVEFAVNRVIPGWTEGIQKIGKGGKIKLYIPQNLAYGDQSGGGSVPAMSTLIFEVTLLDVKEMPKEDEPLPPPSEIK